MVSDVSSNLIIMHITATKKYKETIKFPIWFINNYNIVFVSTVKTEDIDQGCVYHIKVFSTP